MFGMLRAGCHVAQSPFAVLRRPPGRRRAPARR
jgi:hypothetical protein